MKIAKLITLIFFVMLASCSSIPQSIPNTKKHTETVQPKPTLKSFIPTKILQNISTVAPTPTAIEGVTSITAMALDNADYLWIATSIDVIRWNIETSQYIRYKYEKNIESNDMNEIVSIVSNADGSILTLSRFGRAMKLMNGVWTTIVNIKEPYHLGGSINVQQDETLWIALGFLGAYQYNGKSLKYIQIPKQFDCGFYSILEGNGELWAIDGVCRKQPTILRKYNDAKWTEIKGYFPTELLADRDGNIWFLDSDAGVVRADLSDKIDFPTKEYSFYNGSVFAPDGSLWLASYQNGIYRYLNGKWAYIDTGYTIDKITSIVIGKDGSVYIGTDGYGMFFFIDSKWTHYTLKQ